MNRKEKEIFRQLLQIHSSVISILDDENAEKIGVMLKKLDSDLKNIKGPEGQEQPAFWRIFARMSDEDIRKEFNDQEKYPTLESIKGTMRGILEMSQVSKIKTRETLIEHILRVKHRDDYIRGIVKGGENEGQKRV
jgi:hypothetical protein